MIRQVILFAIHLFEDRKAVQSGCVRRQVFEEATCYNAKHNVARSTYERVKNNLKETSKDLDSAKSKD